MSEYGGASEPHSGPPHAHVEKSPISVGWVVLAAVLCGLGLVGVWWWVTTFNWLFFPSIVLVFGGGLMFFNDRAGLDRA
jgi:hypothetical protein